MGFWQEPRVQKILDTIPNVFLSTVYGDKGCTARVISSGGKLEYSVIILYDLEHERLWGSCDCKKWREQGSTTYVPKWCKHLFATVIVWRRGLRAYEERGVSPSHSKP